MALGQDEFIAYQIDLAGASFIQIPITFGVNVAGTSGQKLVVAGEDTDITFTFSGLCIDSDGNSYLSTFGQWAPGSSESNLITSGYYQYSGLLTVTNRHATAAKYYTIGIDSYSLS